MVYFAYGFPRIFGADVEGQGDGSQETLVSAEFDDTRNLLATISRSALIIWSGGQHRAVLAIFRRDAQSVAADGGNKQVVWKRDSKQLAILTEGGFLHTYAILHKAGVRRKPVGGKYHFDMPLDDVNIQFDQRIESSKGAVCSICAEGSHFIAGTVDGYILTVIWPGKVTGETPILDMLPPSRPGDADLGSTPAESAIVHLASSSELHVAAAVFGDGSCAVFDWAARKKGGSAGGTWVQDAPAGATAAAFNVAYQEVSVGLVTGDVRAYKVVRGAGFVTSAPAAVNRGGSPVPSVATGVDENSEGGGSGDVALAYMRTASLSHWGFTAEITGPVRCLRWTADYCALAVGYATRGLTVWSVSGCRLMSTLPQIASQVPRPAPPAPSPAEGAAAPMGPRELVLGGVLSLAWGPGGYFLAMVPSVGPAPAGLRRAARFVQLSFVKGALCGNPVQNERSRLLLQGPDRVLLVHSVRNLQLEELSLHHLPAPPAYVLESATNWPIRLVSASDDGSQIAVAGNRGAALYNSATRRWRVFGDVNQEQAVTALAVAWFSNFVVVIANQLPVPRGSRQPPQYELLFFPRSHLDMTSLLWREKLPARPLILDCNTAAPLRPAAPASLGSLRAPPQQVAGQLLVYTADATVALYSLAATVDGAAPSAPSPGPGVPGRSPSPPAGPPESVQLRVSVVRRLSLTSANAAHPLVMRFLTPALSVQPSASAAVAYPPSPSMRGLEAAGRSGSFGSGRAAAPSPPSARCLVMGSDGVVCVLDLDPQPDAEAAPARDVYVARSTEQLWYSAVGYPPAPRTAARHVGHHSWWAYGDQGLFVWFPDLDGTARRPTDPDPVSPKEPAPLSPPPIGQPTPSPTGALPPHLPERWLELDREVYPVGVFPELSSVVGMSQGIDPTAAAPVPCFQPRVKQQLFLHCLLRHLLAEGRDALALRVARRFSGRPHFAHALEWLLHDAVEDDTLGADVLMQHGAGPLRPAGAPSPTPPEPTGLFRPIGSEPPAGLRPPPPPRATLGPLDLAAGPAASPNPGRTRSIAETLLPGVIALMRNFPDFPEIIVRCARKTDDRRWPRLFSLAGHPSALFEECFASGRLRTAACYLVILHNTGDLWTSNLQALKLLEAALETAEYELARDVVRFLSVHEGNAPLATTAASLAARLRDKPAPPPPLPGASSRIPGHPSRKRVGAADAGAGALLADGEDIYTVYILPALERLMSRHARALLSQYRLKQTLRFIRNVTQFQLVPFLAKEGERANVGDWRAALAAVHEQFHLPLPKTLPTPLFHPRSAAAGEGPALPRQSSGSGAGEEGLQRGGSFSLPPQQQAQRDLEQLLAAALDGNAEEWACVLAVALLDGTLLVRLVEDCRRLLPRLRAALADHPCATYRALLAAVERELHAAGIAAARS